MSTQPTSAATATWLLMAPGQVLPVCWTLYVAGDHGPSQPELEAARDCCSVVAGAKVPVLPIGSPISPWVIPGRVAPDAQNSITWPLLGTRTPWIAPQAVIALGLPRSYPGVDASGNTPASGARL